MHYLKCRNRHCTNEIPLPSEGPVPGVRHLCPKCRTVNYIASVSLENGVEVTLLPPTAIELIRNERREQSEKFGYDEAHDDRHRNGEILDAAVLAMLDMPDMVKSIRQCRGRVPYKVVEEIPVPPGWELFAQKFREKTDDIDKLVVALALGVAELERRLRARESDLSINKEES